MMFMAMKMRACLRSAIVLAFTLILPFPAAAQALSEEEQKIVDYVREHMDEAVSLVEKVVNINSGTLNLEGVRQVGQIFRSEFDSIGFETQWISMPDDMNRAGHLFAEREGDSGKRLLLIGHLDTVFEPDSPFQTFERENGVARGPGVMDMKGGDVAILYALKALDSVGALDGTTITVAFIGDEEKAGKPIEVSRKDLIEAAKNSDAALGFEYSVGGVAYATVARRGSSGWTLDVSGKRGHSSQIFSDTYGAGAIFEAARILNGFYNDVRGEQYLTFNPGIIVGGTDVQYTSETASGTAAGKTNVIAQKVIVDGGLRFISEEQKEKAREAMRQVVAQNLPQTSAEITFKDSYPAMPPTDGNMALLKVLDQVSQDLGHGPVEALDPGKRGAADTSFVAPHVAALDGIGAAGERAHTTEEQMDLEVYPIIVERAALLIYRLTRPGV